MKVNSEIFDCAGLLNGREIPRFWREWSPFQRSEWLKGQGLAADALAAMAILQEAGEWEVVEAESLPTSREVAVERAEPSAAEIRRKDRSAVEMLSPNSRPGGWWENYDNY